MEHPDISRTLQTGYPNGDGGAGFYCDLCTREIMLGREYIDHGGKYICRRCLERMVMTAGESEAWST